MLQTRPSPEGIIPSHLGLGALPDNDTSSAHSDQSITTPSTSPPCVSEDMDSPYHKTSSGTVPEPLDLMTSVSELSTPGPRLASQTPSIRSPSSASLESGPPTLTTADAQAARAAAAAAASGETRPVSPAASAKPEGKSGGKADKTDKADKADPRAESAARAALAAHKRNSTLDDVLVGTRVSEGHENFVTAYNMLTGIRYAVSRCNAKIQRDLIESDFTTTTEISFDMSGQSETPSTKYMFRFKDYAPWVFRHLRDLFGLDPADYLMAMTAKYIVSELGSPGKSGSFFYYSRDYRFIIKTIRHSEHKRLRQILKLYYQHVRDNPNTLISQFYGLHRVRLPFGRKIHFVVMNNVFPALHEIHRRYDLKGSTLGRMYNAEDGKPMVVLKDLDWLQNHERIVLGPAKREQFMRQLELDVQMLQRANVMDYSLLIGIHDKSKGNSALNALTRFKQFGPDTDEMPSADGRRGRRPHQEQTEFARLQRQLQDANPTALTDFSFDEQFRAGYLFYRDSGGFQSTDPGNNPRDIIYYMGIIDFLTAYSFKKRVETFCKSLVHRRSELSAVPAFEYGERFFRFLCLAVGSPIERKERRAQNTTTFQSASDQPGDQSDRQPNGESGAHASDEFNGQDTDNAVTTDSGIASEGANEVVTPDAHSPSLTRVISNASGGTCATAVSKSSSGETEARPQLTETSKRASIIAYR